MALIFESIQIEGIAQLSYLVGDDTAGIAAVFDPRPDVESMSSSSVVRVNFVRVLRQRKYTSVTKETRVRLRI